jgi:hypothetical protein
MVQNNRHSQIEPYVVLASAGVAGGSLIVLQLFTTADPIGRCLTFWKQLRRQVRWFFMFSCFCSGIPKQQHCLWTAIKHFVLTKIVCN